MDINKIRKITKEREEIKQKTYKFILEMCNNKITTFAKHGVSYCYYEIPKMVSGYSKYSIDDCSDYLINKIKSAGYNVELYKHFNYQKNDLIYILLITWFN